MQREPAAELPDCYVSVTVRVTVRVWPAPSAIFTVIVAVTFLRALTAFLTLANTDRDARVAPFGTSVRFTL